MPACSRIKSAASNGASAYPVVPPTWKIDCANPRFFPAASDVILDASGCTTDDPIPDTNTANINIVKFGAYAMRIKPVIVQQRPNGKNQPTGRLSKIYPKTGCIIDDEI